MRSDSAIHTHDAQTASAIPLVSAVLINDYNMSRLQKDSAERLQEEEKQFVQSGVLPQRTQALSGNGCHARNLCVA